ncbi:MAG: DUF4838 domain-containing protein [Armatimonadota bacterium]
MHTADITTELRLADKGTTDYVITLASPTEQERTAAFELAAYLLEITGVAFPMAEQAQAGGQPQIAVGYHAARGVGVSASTFNGLGEEGIIIRSNGQHLALTGGEGAKRGTLYAVFTFLEEVLGCRWWTPDAADIPRRETLDIPQVARWYVPPFEYREQCYKHTQDLRWTVRNRFNANQGLEVPTAWGCRHVYKPFVHTFFNFVPPKEHFAAHPEWFSEVGGVRVDNGQLCLANPEMTAFFIDQVKALLRAHPEVTIVSVSQNDWDKYCQCAACQAVDRKEESPAGSVLGFVNTVAEAIEAEFPQVAVDTLAYSYTRKPPKYARPRGNVIVRFCSFECDFLHPFEHPNNLTFHRDMEAWARICDRVYVWDYVTNFAHYVQPFPNWFTLAEHVRYFAAHHVKGLFSEGNYTSVGGEMSELRAWVLAKLHWDPSRDIEALVGEFLQGYYGRAANHLEQYLRSVYRRATGIPRYDGSLAIQRHVKLHGYDHPHKTGCYLDLNSPADAPYLDPDTMLEAARHFAAAESALRGDDVLLNRVRVAKLAAWYVLLLRWNVMRAHAERTGQEWPLPDDRLTACREFNAICERNTVTHLAEGWANRDPAWLEALCASGKDVETNDG